MDVRSSSVACAFIVVVDVDLLSAVSCCDADCEKWRQFRRIWLLAGNNKRDDGDLADVSTAARAAMRPMRPKCIYTRPKLCPHYLAARPPKNLRD